ncbi:hypothetical protein CsatA_023005 [Cannabis sativa]
MWRKTYEPMIHPIPDESMWIRNDYDYEPLLPPIIKNQPGRPKKYRRKRVAGEERVVKPVSSTKRCKKCNQLGHNSCSCSMTPLMKEPTTPTSPTRRGNGRGSEQGKGLSKDQATTFDAPPMTSSEPVNKKRGRGRPRGRGHGRIHYTTNQENYQPQESIEEHTLKNAEELNIHGAPSDLFQSQPTQ